MTALKALPETAPSLVLALRDGSDERAWNRFLSVYAPIVVGFLLRSGLQVADAEDVAQEVFRTVIRRIGEWNPAREGGKFRNWLFVIVRSRLIDHRRTRDRSTDGSADATVHRALDETPAREDADHWEAEYRNRLLKRATNEIRDELSERAWKCFYLSAIEAIPADEIAAKLGMTPGAVYTTKSRTIARLRERVREIEDDWQ